MDAVYRVSSHYDSELGGYTGRVHFYQPWSDSKKHDAMYERFLWSESTRIVRQTAYTAQLDAELVGRELTGLACDN